MSRDEVLHRAAAHGTSDFALTVMAATGKTAMASYRTAESPLKALCRKQTLRDFKASTAIRLGEMGELEEMAENGEFTATSRAEEGESINLKTFGRRIDLTRNLIINDDLNLLSDTVRAFGEAAAQTEAAIMVEMLTGNPDMRDGTPVFDASRGNIGGSVGVPNKLLLTENREATQCETDLLANPVQRVDSPREAPSGKSSWRIVSRPPAPRSRAWLWPIRATGNALAQVVGAAPFHDRHGRLLANIVRGILCGEVCCKTSGNNVGCGARHSLSCCFYLVNCQYQAGRIGGETGNLRQNQ